MGHGDIAEISPLNRDLFNRCDELESGKISVKVSSEQRWQSNAVSIDVHKDAEVRKRVDELEQIGDVVSNLLLIRVHLLELGLEELANSFHSSRNGLVVRVVLRVGLVGKLGLLWSRKQVMKKRLGGMGVRRMAEMNEGWHLADLTWSAVSGRETDRNVPE